MYVYMHGFLTTSGSDMHGRHGIISGDVNLCPVSNKKSNRVAVSSSYGGKERSVAYKSNK